MSEHIKTAWDSYRRDVMPANPVPGQTDETRKAFYAGAVAVMNCVCRAPDADAGLVRVIVDIHAELAAFLDQFKREHGA